VAADLSKIAGKQNENRNTHDDLWQKGPPDAPDMPRPTVSDDKHSCRRQPAKRIPVDFRLPPGCLSNGCILGDHSYFKPFSWNPAPLSNASLAVIIMTGWMAGRII